MAMIDTRKQQLVWRKSTRSMGGDNECVCVGFGGNVVAIRDSKDPSGHILEFSRDDWINFLGGVRALPD